MNWISCVTLSMKRVKYLNIYLTFKTNIYNNKYYEHFGGMKTY